MEFQGRLRNMATVYLTSGDNILLLYRIGSRVVNDVWTGSAGGHFEKEELSDAKACVLREMKEELGLEENDIKNLRFRYLTVRLADNEIRQNYYFFAELPQMIKLSSPEGELKWFSLSEISGLSMPYSAKCMTDHWLSEGRFNDKIYVGVTNAGESVFTELKEEKI